MQNKSTKEQKPTFQATVQRCFLLIPNCQVTQTWERSFGIRYGQWGCVSIEFDSQTSVYPDLTNDVYLEHRVIYIRTRGRTGIYTRSGMRACGHFLSWQNSIAQHVFVREFCKLTKHRVAFTRHKLQLVLHIQRAYRMACLSLCGPIAFVDAASPVRPLVLIQLYDLEWNLFNCWQCKETITADCLRTKDDLELGVFSGWLLSKQYMYMEQDPLILMP